MKLTYLLIAIGFFSYSQDSCKKIPDNCDNPCGPIEKIQDRIIVGESMASLEPYNFVIHQTFNRFFGKFSSTSSFIAPNVLITAHHNVRRKGLIKGITFYNPLDHQQTIYFKKKEIEIYFYKSKLGVATDIAIIIFKNKLKIAPFYFGCFQLQSIENITSTKQQVHLTGFPCDISNTKVDKSDSFVNILPHETKPLLGYNMFTCTGDSGAPLWIIENNNPTILGIHHGGNEGYFNNCYNIAAKIDSNVINWINKFIN
jgi:V8-like Glu-specific endopeptidase